MTSWLSRRRLLTWSGSGALLAVAGCATRAGTSADSAAVAPTGVLRASINFGNPVLAQRDPVTGAPAGVSVDLARALAVELGVACELVTFDAAAKSVVAVTSEEADVGFFAIDPLRGEGIAFTAPYVLIEGVYAVRSASALTDNAQVDRAGTRVVVGRGSAYDLYLSRVLKAAELVRTPTSPAVVPTLLGLDADAGVAAGVRQQLLADAARLGGVRLLPGRFMVIEQAMGVPAKRGEAARKAVAGFVERAKASGLVAAALRRHGIEGATVAPAA